jgi:hypothetical protein
MKKDPVSEGLSLRRTSALSLNKWQEQRATMTRVPCEQAYGGQSELFRGLVVRRLLEVFKPVH